MAGASETVAVSRCCFLQLQLIHWAPASCERVAFTQCMTPVSWHTETAGAGGSLRRALGAAAGTAAAAVGESKSAPAPPFPNSSRPISSSKSSATGAASCVAASPPACCIAVPHTRVSWDFLLRTHSMPLELWLHGPLMQLDTPLQRRLHWTTRPATPLPRASAL